MRTTPTLRQAALWTLLLAPAALAQDTGSEQPPVPDPDDRVLIAPDEPVVLEPWGREDPDDPLGLGLDLHKGPGSKLVADGSYVSRWTGRLVESAPGLWVFAFDADTDGTSPGPVMPVLPSLRLLEMQQLVRDRGGDVTFRVSGHVTIFHNRNYLLPRVVTTVTADRPVDTAPPDPERPDGAGAGGGGDPSIEQLLERVREAAPPTEVMLRTQPDPRDEERRLLREGSSVLSVTGRVVRRDEGAFEFVVDNGVFSDPSNDAPAVLLPCLMTEEIGRLVDERGDRVRFSLSGEVFVYAGRNYVLPLLYRIEPRERPGALVPAR